MKQFLLRWSLVLLAILFLGGVVYICGFGCFGRSLDGRDNLIKIGMTREEVTKTLGFPPGRFTHRYRVFDGSRELVDEDHFSKNTLFEYRLFNDGYLTLDYSKQNGVFRVTFFHFVKIGSSYWEGFLPLPPREVQAEYQLDDEKRDR
jgi:hypothetical protein